MALKAPRGDMVEPPGPRRILSAFWRVIHFSHGSLLLMTETAAPVSSLIVVGCSLTFSVAVHISSYS